MSPFFFLDHDVNVMYWMGPFPSDSSIFILFYTYKQMTSI
uniref:Uncharacterized protein n=1 Tax=Arundo donax TaxID=35708 RepID=A0A0A9G5Y9_ARUDO